METMRKAPRLTNQEDEGESEKSLDAKVWGQLQEYLPLHTIYEKLSQRDLFRLRLVSKEWNHAALQWTLPKPSFVTIATAIGRCDVPFLKGVVTYNSVSGKVEIDRELLPLLYVQTHVSPFEVEGLVVCHNPDDLEERGVFNVHTQTWHVVCPSPQRSKTLSACGLWVDTSVKPYTFKLIEGNQKFRTQVYDSKSRSWSIKSSRLPSSTSVSRAETLEYSCICNNGNVYMSNGTHKFWKYSLEDDKWANLKFPKKKDRLNNPSPDNTLGVWEGRIFTAKEDHKKQRITVWELMDHSEWPEWVEYARMPKEHYCLLVKSDTDFYFGDGVVYLRSFFRDGYLLIGSWRFEDVCANVLSLFDIGTKTWQKVDLPVAIGKQELESSTYEGVGVDEDEEIDEEDVDEDHCFDEVDHIREVGDVGGHVYVQEQFS